MGVQILKVEGGYLLKGDILKNIKHREVLFTGGFYEKELEETKAGVYAEMEKDDLILVDYRDKIHNKEEGSKKELVELITSFMTIIYLVKRGVIYEPFRSPMNFVHNEKTLRLQVMGRKGSELAKVDEDFLEWVLKMIAFMISEKPVDTFEEYELIDYARDLDQDKRKLLAGYLKNNDLEGLFEYTIEESLRDILDDYLPIKRVPKDNKPSIVEIKEKMEEKERERIARIEEEQRRIERQKEELARLKRAEELRKEKESLKAKVKGLFTRSKEKERIRKEREFSERQRLLREDDVDRYREDLGLSEGKRPKNYAVRTVIMETILDLVSIGFLVGAIYLAYVFVTWLMN